MRKIIMAIFVLAFATIGYGQTSQTKFFKSEWLDHEVPENKAKYSQTITQNTDGTTTSEVKNIRKNEVVQSETYKGNEPYGIWKFRYGNGFQTIDYNFPLIYAEEKCDDSLSIAAGDFFQNNDSLGYKAPKLSTGDLTIYQYLAKSIIYPARAREMGIQGTVYLQLTLTADGAENVVVKRGVDISLDKEAVRVLKALKFSSPPTLNGKSVVIKCLTLPIRYKLM